VRTGLVFGYGNPHVTNNIERIVADDLTLGSYTKVDICYGLALSGFLAYGNKNYKYRHNSSQTTYGGDAMSVSLELSRTWLRYSRLQLCPTFAADFQKTWTDGFTTADTDQIIEKSSIDQTVLRIGLNSQFQALERLNLRTRLQYGFQVAGDLSAPSKHLMSRISTPAAS
jgi:hypothetical protein